MMGDGHVMGGWCFGDVWVHSISWTGFLFTKQVLWKMYCQKCCKRYFHNFITENVKNTEKMNRSEGISLKTVKMAEILFLMLQYTRRSPLDCQWSLRYRIWSSWSNVPFVAVLSVVCPQRNLQLVVFGLLPQLQLQVSPRRGWGGSATHTVGCPLALGRIWGGSVAASKMPFASRRASVFLHVLWSRLVTWRPDSMHLSW